MKINAAFLRSKVGRRIFLLFVLCALLPIAALAVISFSQVTNQLRDQALERLQQAGKSLAMSSTERLMLLEVEMRALAPAILAGEKAALPAPSQAPDESLQLRFLGLVAFNAGGRMVPIAGHLQNLPKLGPGEKQHLLSGKTLLSTAIPPSGKAQVFMSCPLDLQDPARGILVGEINTSYLWDSDTLPLQTDLCVLDVSSRVLSCTPGVSASFREQVPEKIAPLSRGQFEWGPGSKSYLVSYWSMPLKFSYFTPGWTVVLSESKAHALAPLARFKATFPFIVLVALWIVLLLSVVQIRRSLVPLESLQEGTRRIAARDFESQVSVTSGDEFEELAHSFNSMSHRLGRQFNALTTIAEIDRSVLAALDTETIVDTVLARLPVILPCDFASVTLLDAEAPGTVRTYVPTARMDEKWWRMNIRPEEMQKLRDNRESLLIRRAEDFPKFVAPLTVFGVKSALLLPIFLDQELSGIINVGYRQDPNYSPDDLAQARQLADQVAVALSNARLIEKLKQLNWGTLTALARAIDAKSPWTSGHSERVTNLACELAAEMGYKDKDLDRMRRGGLLHDIGKIGTPPEVLDKPGRLDPEELKKMRAHVRMGAHILEPIHGFAELLPIVLQHHEWVNGGGYPEGLVGDAISLDARIFAVADCYDALISDRPYRAGLPRERVIEMILEGSGRQFDPGVLEAFLRLMKTKTEKELEGVAAQAVEALKSEAAIPTAVPAGGVTGSSTRSSGN